MTTIIELVHRVFKIFNIWPRLFDETFESWSIEYFLVKVFIKVFFFCYFEWKIYFESCEKFINIILFVDYIKFDPQIFDCYIYFVLNIFFQFHLLEFDFYINFGLHFYNCYLFFPYNFLIEIFYLPNLVLVLLIVT